MATAGSSAAESKPRPAGGRDLMFLCTPALWATWPVLPVVRPVPGGETECGLVYDCWTVAGRPGYSATVFLCNLFLMPQGEKAFLELPRRVYDTPEELLADGWWVD